MRSRALSTPSALRAASFSGPPMPSALAVRVSSSLSNSLNATSVSLCLFDEPARDDELLDLARALENAEQPHVAVKPFDCVILHVTGAAVDLHRTVGHAAAHLGGKIFAARRFDRDAGAVVA